jgi:hypothetical protein
MATKLSRMFSEYNFKFEGNLRKRSKTAMLGLPYRSTIPISLVLK